MNKVIDYFKNYEFKVKHAVYAALVAGFATGFFGFDFKVDAFGYKASAEFRKQ